MAVIQDIRLATQAVLWLENIRRDERANAQAYMDAVTAGKGVQAIINVAKGDAAAYLNLLSRLYTAYQASTASFQAGFAAMGLSTSELVSAYNELKNAAQTLSTSASSATTADDINTFSQAVLNAVTAHADVN